MRTPMHDDELDVPEALVRRLVDAQFPEWRALPLERLALWGTDNAMYRLGAELVVRLPRREACVAGLERERTWLPVLGPRLPVPIPEPVAFGDPSADFPLPWGVYRYLDGVPATDADVDAARLATDLAAFIRALQAVPPPERPFTSGRGVPLAERDGPVRERIPQIASDVDADRVTAFWEHALAAPVWDGPPIWIHGDLMPMNLLIRDGRLAGVLDFGACGVGDPACEALAAWVTLPNEVRGAFRELLDLDDAGWARARGWALSTGVMALPYYRETYPELAAIARRTLERVLADELE